MKESIKFRYLDIHKCGQGFRLNRLQNYPHNHLFDRPDSKIRNSITDQNLLLIPVLR